MMIWGNALGKTRTCGMLYALPFLSHRYLLFSNNIVAYQKKIAFEQPHHILSLGNYRKTKYPIIHIETVAKTVTGDDIDIPYKRQTHPNIICSRTIGTGRCNFFTREMILFLKTLANPPSYTFFHIPQNMPIERAVAILSDLQSIDFVCSLG